MSGKSKKGYLARRIRFLFEHKDVQYNDSFLKKKFKFNFKAKHPKGECTFCDYGENYRMTIQ